MGQEQWVPRREEVVRSADAHRVDATDNAPPCAARGEVASFAVTDAVRSHLNAMCRELNACGIQTHTLDALAEYRNRGPQWDAIRDALCDRATRNAQIPHLANT